MPQVSYLKLVRVSVYIPDSFSGYKIMFCDHGHYGTTLCPEVSIGHGALWMRQ